MTERLAFRPIGIPNEVTLAARHRRDSFVVSFGHDEPFDDVVYAGWLGRLAARMPEGVVFATLGGSVVGQIEAQVRPDGTGYVNLFYLVEPYRGRGLGRQLHDYVLRVFEERNVERVELAVSPTNARAIRFYEKMGYRSLGLRSGATPPVDEMRLALGEHEVARA